MKKFNCTFLLLIIISIQLKAQWEWQNPCSIKFHFNSIHFVNSQIGFAASDYGIVLKTTNGGVDWIELFTNAESHLRSITFIDENIGWAVGDGGLFISTIDGGSSWVKSDINSTINFYKVQFIDSDYGWVCGSGGKIYYSNDGGKSWNEGNTNTNYSINSLYFISRTKGWAVSSYSPVPVVSNILRTTDGGLNWITQQANLDGPLHCIYLLDETNGWAGGSKVYRMQNGINWQYQTTIFGINHIQFINSQKGWAVGTEGQINITNDGGVNWVRQHNFTDNRLLTCYFTDENNGWIGGRDGIILNTTNGGNKWVNQTNYFKFNFYASHFLNDNLGWVCGFAVGQRGPILRTTNSGKNWVILSVLEFTARSICFFDSLNGFVLSEMNEVGRLLKTSNGGIDWELTWLEYDCAPVKMQFINNHGWILDSKKRLYTSNDRGANWVKDTLNFYQYLPRGFQFLDSTLGWLVGYSGIYKTTDGGNNWIQQIDTPLITIHFIDSLTGWAGGLDGTFAKTTDGGNNWAISTTTTLYDAFQSIFTIDSLNAIASAYKWGGYIIRTTNGGIDWYDEFRNIGDNPVFNINSNDTINYWALGTYGLIAKYKRETTTGIDELKSNPRTFSLSQNYPNPFNPSTKISWQSPVSGHQTLKVYDVLGREVATLVDEYRDAGSYEVEFQSALGNRQLASGIYYYQLKVGDSSSSSGQGFVETRKMILTK